MGLLGVAVLAGCGGPSTSSAPDLRGVHFVHAALAWDPTLPVNPGGPNMRTSGEVVSGSGARLDTGSVKAYVLDGTPARAKLAVTTVAVHGGTFVKSFGVVGPGGHRVRLDYVVGGTVLASTVVTG